MKKTVLYSYEHCPQDKQEENKLNIERVKETAYRPEKIILEILLTLPDIEYVETEYQIGNLKTDFRLHFTNGTIRRCEVNGEHHFYGRERQGNLNYINSWKNYIIKQNDALLNNEPCLNINCLVKGSDETLGFQKSRWIKQLNTLKWLKDSRKFRQAMNKLKCSNLNKNVNVNIVDDVLSGIKFTYNNSIDNTIKQILCNPDYIISTL